MGHSRAGRARDDRAVADGVRFGNLSGQLEDPFAVEHDEDLFLGRVTVRRARERAWIGLEVLEAGPSGAGRAAGVAPAPTTPQIRNDVLRRDVHRRPGRL